MTIIDRLDGLRGAIDVLEHPFYLRWSAGELRDGELALYAGEYRHAVRALAQASQLAADTATEAHAEGLRRHAAEEREHVAVWEQFAAACGAGPALGDAEPELPQTRDCAAAWRAGDGLLEHLAVLYVLEAGQPAISHTKLAGLTGHYGYSPEGPATEYFRLHEQLDVEHARQARELILELLAEDERGERDAERMLTRARAALQGNWRLLDGVQERAAV